MTFIIIGIIANIFVMLRAIPQIIKIFYYQSAWDVSYLTNWLIILYSIFWLAYGILDFEYIVLTMSLILIISSILIISLKFFFDKKLI